MSPHRITDVPVRPSDRRNLRRSYVAANAFEAMIGVSAMISGVATFVAPDSDKRSSLVSMFGDFAMAWPAAYVVSGALIIFGLLRPNIRLEVAGLCLLAGAISGHAVAIIAFSGWIGVAFAVFYIGWAVASLIRARLVVRLSHIVSLGAPGRLTIDDLENPRPLLDPISDEEQQGWRST